MTSSIENIQTASIYISVILFSFALVETFVYSLDIYNVFSSFCKYYAILSLPYVVVESSGVDLFKSSTA